MFYFADNLKGRKYLGAESALGYVSRDALHPHYD
jgi:hypothetical protein